MREKESAQPTLLACLKMPLLHELAMQSGEVYEGLGHQIMSRLTDHLPTPEKLVFQEEGDIFIHLAESAAGEGNWKRKVDGIMRCLSKPYLIRLPGMPEGKTDVILSVFCGVCPIESAPNGKDIRNARLAAREAMTAGISASRGIVVYEKGLRDAAQRRFAHKQIVLTAIGDGSLQVHYQRKICLKTGKTKGFEALIRPPKAIAEPWSSQAGAFGAGEIVSAINDLNLMAELTVHVLETVTRDMEAWDRLYPNLAPTVSINIPPRSLVNGWILISRALEKVCTPERVIIEITEQDLGGSEDTRQLSSLINTLRDHGFGISIDDFGMGHSNLSRLSGLPFTEIKLDRSLTQSLARNPMNHNLVKQLVEVTKGQDLTIIAEGVETEQEKATIQSLGIYMAQGFLFGKPESGANVARRLGVELRKDALEARESKASNPRLRATNL